MWNKLKCVLLLIGIYGTCASANKCLSGWLERDSNCYKKEMTPNGWLGARHHCVWQGGDLVSITSSAEEDFVKDTMGNTRFWLGLSNQKCDDVWCGFVAGSQELIWSDGNATTHTNWALDHFKSADVASCAYVNQGAHYSSGKWRSGSCASSLAYMCKRPLSCGRMCTSNNVSAVMKTSDCDDGNLLYGDDCYLFDATRRTWDDGEKFCLARRGHLASIHSDQEARFMADHSTHSDTWVGEKKKGNNYEWTDGRPNDYKTTRYYSGGGACSELWGANLWKNDRCHRTQPLVCKTAKRGGPPQLPPLVGQPDWTQKCGWWLDDPTNDFCYLMIRQPTKTWQEAQADCQRLHGNLLSITDDHEQTFVHGYVKGLTNASPLWLGANVDVSAKGSEWADESPIEYVHSIIGTFDRNCLSFLTGTGDWKYDSCQNKRGYVCKKRGNVKATPAPDSNKCLPGWLAHDSSCYKKEMIPNGWLGAWHHCVWVGGNLLSITSSAEEDFVKRTMGEDTRFWLGLSNQKCGKVWCRFEGGSQNLTWSDNQTTTYTNWASNQLKSADVASCAYVNQGGSGEPGKWRSGSCRSSLAYMCKRPLSCPKGQTCSLKRGPAVVKTSDCQGNTFHYGDYCYRYEKTEKTFDDAEKFCRSREGHLASVHSKEEAQFVSDHSQTSQSVFVGLKKEDDDYEWSDGTTYDYNDWKNDAKGDCAFPNSDGELSASSCTTKRPFVCKRAQHGGLPQLPALVGQPEWTDTCGWWLNDPTNDFCYLMIRQPTKTWKEAQANCQRLHGNLLSITDHDEQIFVHGYVMSLPSLWLGADVSTTKYDPQWTDGSPFTYIHSSAGDPGEGKCLSLFTANGVWKHDTCDEKRSYVCKKMKKGVAELSLSSDASKCAPGWLVHGTNCYKKVEEPNGWLGAWHHCVWEGGDLLSITTSAEEDFVKDTMGKDTRFWLGLSNQKCDDVWCRFEGESQNLTWSDGENTTHTNWAPNQDESADVASCAYVNQGGMGQPGEWRSGSCDSSLAYMCKRPLSCPEGRTCSPKSGLAVVKTSTCDNGNLLYGDHCYFYSKLHKDWEDAEKFCVAQRGHLASVHSQQEAQFVFDHSQSLWYSWLGLKKKSNNYEYSDGTAFDYPGWQENTTEDCAFPNSVGKIGGSPCTIKRPFVCKTAKREGPPQLPPLVGQLGWTDTCDWWLNDPTNNFCYLMIREPTKTWKEAQADCQRLHGNLLSITDHDEQTFVHGYIMSLPSLWLGADVSTTEHDAQWTDGSPFTYIHSSAGDAKGGKCLSLSTDSGVWKHDTCDKKKGYVCKKMKKGVAELSLSSDASKCVPGWLEHGTNCYKKVEEPNGWLGAWHHCVWVGGNLLSVTSSAEEDFVKGTMGENTRFWLGLSNQKCDDLWCRFEGGSQNLTWSDGETTTHTNWASNQLKSANVASCAYVNQGGRGEPGKWRSGSCDSSLAYMCKRPLSCLEGQTCSPKSGLAVVKTSTCDNGNLLYGDHCYFYSKLYKDWEDAEKFCVAQRGHLASVHSWQEAQFVFDHSQSVSYSWLGLKKKSNNYEYSDGTTFDYAEWQDDTTGDCAFPNSVGKIGGSPCTTKRPFVCKTAKRGGPRQLPPLVSQQGWTDKCGWWLDYPEGDFCYLMIRQPTKTWQEAQADCKGRQGNLLSIADSLEQRFVRGIAKFLGMNDDVSLWLGADASIKGDGDKWTDGSPFSYLHSSAGVSEGGKCLSLLTGSGDWKFDKCDEKRDYVCKKRGKTHQLPPHDGYKEELVCQGDWKTLDCPDERVIRIRSAFHGRKRSDVCPSGGGSRDDCRVEGALRHLRGLCDNYQICLSYLTDTDSCPGVSKYLHIVYSCEKKVCHDSLGIADGRIPDSSFSASSSAINAEPHKARLGGSDCWKSSKIFDSWIQVNLSQNFKVTGVKTQSCTYQFQSSSVFAMQFSIDGVTWYRHPVQPSVGTYLLTRPVFAQYVRLLPMFLGLRFDVLGCTSDDTTRNILCNSTATDLGLNGSMTVRCPLGCAQAGYKLYGTRLYKQDSNICAAAIHSGVIEIGGDVTLLKRPPQKAYDGSTCNGINSTVYVDRWDPSPSFTFADTEPRCLGPDWEEFADFCYKHFDTKKTWYSARHSCWGLDANLVSFRSEAEWDWLQDLMKLAPGDTWTGLNDLVNRGRFVWSDSQKVPTFTNWAAPGRPTGVMENCVAALSQSGKWKKMSCMQLNGYVCKMPTARYALDIKGANGSCE